MTVPHKKGFYLKIVKPVLDFISAAVILTVTLPITIIAILLLIVVNRGKVWFIQERPGRDERIFRVIKFRTMNDKRDSAGNLYPDEQRLTPIGKLIRKTSIDELPQFLNVLKGEMAIVGPRPLLTEYLALYSDDQRRRHLVKPGITGWAQVNGRNTLSWKKKFEYDVWYVDNVSFGLDLKILILTVVKVFRAEGITSNTSATMEKFDGKN